MINMKTTTQSWSTAPQESSLKTSQTQTISAADQEKYFGDQNVGEILNKVADPNWVEPSKLRKVGDNHLDKDAFLKLLLAQLKNQDPTNPMKSHEMAAQLAQFTSLEKLTNIDTGIENLSKTGNSKTEFDALNLIGKAVSGDNSKIIRTNDSEQHELRFDLAKSAVSADVKIRDANGQVIREQTLSGLKEGTNTFTWNGMNEDGAKVPKGEYQLIIEAKDISGAKVHSNTRFSGVITGVNFTPDGTVLKVGSQSVRLSDVKSITNPSLVKTDAVNQAEVVKRDDGVMKADGQPKSPSAANTNLIDNVAMSREMINRLQKETGNGQN